MSNEDVVMKVDGETLNGDTTAANNGVQAAKKGGQGNRRKGGKGKFFANNRNGGGGNRRFQPYGGGYNNYNNFGNYGNGYYDNYNSYGGYGGYGGGFGGYGGGFGGPYGGGGFGGGYGGNFRQRRVGGGGGGGNRNNQGSGGKLSRQARNRKFKKGDPKNITQIKKLKDVYEMNRKNRFINEDEAFLVVFLKNIFQGITKEKDEEDVPSILRFLMRHHNIVKCLRHEVKKYIDKIYGEGTDEETIKKKKEVLTEKKDKFMNGYKNDYLPKVKKEFNEKYDELVNETVDILTGEKFNPDEHLAKPEDYVMDNTKTEEDFITEFKYYFLKFSYDGFRFRVIDTLSFTRDMGKRVKFHVENKFIPHLVVDYIKQNKKVPKLQTYCAQFVRPIPKHFYERSQKCDELLYKKACENNYKVETNINNYIALNDNTLSAEQLRNLADCLIEFDRHLTINKYKLLNFTPYINIPQETKLKLFDEMKEIIYDEIVNIIKNNISSQDLAYFDMEKDPDYDPTKKTQNEDGETVAVKEEKME